MNISLTEAFAIAGAVGTAVGYYMQSKLSDSYKPRIIRMVTGVAAGISYHLNGNQEAARAYLVGTSRSILRSIQLKNFGDRFKNYLAGAAITAMAIPAFMRYERPADLIPLSATIMFSTGDVDPTGRRQRARLFVGGISSVAMALTRNNWPLVLSDTFAASMIAKGIYQQDVVNAGGQRTTVSMPSTKLIVKDRKAFFKQAGQYLSVKNIVCRHKERIRDFKAYAHAIRFNSPTGAKKEAQVSTDEVKRRLISLEKETLSDEWNEKEAKIRVIDELFDEKVAEKKEKNRLNPYYDPELAAA